MKMLRATLAFWASLALSAAASAQPVEAPEGSAALVAIKVSTAAAGRAELTLAWRNGWRDGEGSARGNFDGVWVFAKRRDDDGRWRHVRIGEASAGEGFSVERVADGTGLFVFRSQPGQGDTRAVLALRWAQAGTAGSAPGDMQRLRIFAWPMVRVPQGGFELGDGSTSTPGRFHAGDDASKPFSVSGAPIDLAQRPGALWADAARTALPAGAPGPVPWDGFSGTLPATFPTGFEAFWTQRFELTQGQYADFLNTLTPEQAAARVPSASEFAAGGRPRPDNYRYTLEQRNGVWRAAQPRWSMNWLTWDDGTAIADWAGLRPMTELEFEKAARGKAAAVPGEYAWGTSRIVAIRGFIGQDGSGTERATPLDANTSWSPTAQDRPLLGPYGAGLLADRESREGRGESFWGVADLSGNLVEMAVTLGLPQGRAFIPNHGDGALTEGGHADVPGWPRIESRQGGYGAWGFGYRGGDFFNPERDLRTSSRNVANFGGTRRLFGLGFRAVRSAGL
jgi:formylglycine-generating enzyme required for sulfatase activity